MRSIAALCAMLAGSAANAELEYSIETGVGHSDNITRVSDNQVDETLASFGLNGTWREHTRRLEADVVADLSYVEYLDNTYTGEVLGSADADFIFGIVPENFTWQVQDSFGQARTNPFEPVTPDNRENVNYFTTGPDLRLRIGGQNTLEIFGRYSATDYEVSPIDGSRTAGGFGFFRELSAASRIGLNGVLDESEFDAPLTPGYERRSAFLSYDLTEGRTQISAQVGYSELEVEGEDGDGGALINLSVTREISPSSSIDVSAGRQFTDAAEALRTASGGGSSIGGSLGGNGDGVTASSAPYEGRDYSVSWNFAKRRTNASLGASRNEVIYETQTTSNRVRDTFFGTFSRQIRSTVGVELSAEFSKEEFGETGFESEDWAVVLQLRWRMSRHLGWRLAAEYYDRATNIGGYQENRAMLYFTYSGGDMGRDSGVASQ